MRIQLSEPVLPRFIHINPETNKVHLLVTIVGGQEISTDNTCRAGDALRNFFGGGAYEQLKGYQKALEIDIELSDNSHPQRQFKEDRLAQILAYIDAIQVRFQYKNAIENLMTKPSNLYSIQLRPSFLDSFSKVINPAFNIARHSNWKGLFWTMQKAFSTAVVTVTNPRNQLIYEVLKTLSSSPTFEEIQYALKEQSLALFGLALDFTRGSDGKSATQPAINALMMIENATPLDYINTLLDYCALNVWTTFSGSSFSNIQAADLEKRTEQLSIMTQFFLAHVNIHCKAKGISSENFGVILDNSHNLNTQLVDLIVHALKEGESIEQVISDFFNNHGAEFKLSRSLTLNDITAIKQKFERTYRTVTATKENPHMDEFMILDMEATGESARFVTHQGSICVNFAELVPSNFSNYDFFASILTDFTNHPIEIPAVNDWISSEVEIDPQALFEKLSSDVSIAAQYIAPVIRSYIDLKTLNFNYALLKAVVTKIESRLSSLPFSTEMLELLPFFSSKQQRIIINTQFEKLIQECTSPEKYQELMSNFEKKAKDKFSRKYIGHWVTSVNSCKDFLALKNKVDDSFLDPVFERLKSKYPILLNTYENTCSILAALPNLSYQKQEIFNFIKPHLYEWLSDDKKYTFFCTLLDDTSKFHLLPYLFAQIKNHCTNLEAWKKHYEIWKGNYLVSSFLLDQLLSELKNEVKDSDTLLPLVEAAEIKDRLRLIKKFKAIINTQELFKKYLALIPNGYHEKFLSSVQFDLFISSPSSLREIVDLFKSDKLRKIIFAQFTPAKLNCTEKRFLSLTGNKFEYKKLEALCRNFDSDTVANRLKIYRENLKCYTIPKKHSFFPDFKENRNHIVTGLINTLTDPNLMPIEKIEALREAERQMSNRSEDDLYFIISSSLEELKPKGGRSVFQKIRRFCQRDDKEINSISQGSPLH